MSRRLDAWELADLLLNAAGKTSRRCVITFRFNINKSVNKTQYKCLSVNNLWSNRHQTEIIVFLCIFKHLCCFHSFKTNLIKPHPNMSELLGLSSSMSEHQPTTWDRSRFTPLCLLPSGITAAASLDLSHWTSSLYSSVWGHNDCNQQSFKVHFIMYFTMLWWWLMES